MAKRIISLVVAVIMMMSIMAPAAEAAVRRVYYRPAPRRVVVVHRVPRPVHRHHHNRTGAFIAGAIIGAILAR